MSTGDELFMRTQIHLAALALHRAEVRNERPDERARRQQIRAEEIARALGSTKPNVVRAMLALVVADEHHNPRGDPVPPVAPGARAALKPKKAKPQPPLRNATPDQIGFWE